MVRQQHQIAWAMMGVVFCGLGAGHCWAQLLLTQSQKPAATQPAPSSVMSAPNLRQQKTAAWRKVCAADKTEIAQIKAAVKADMKAGDADAVVAAEGQLKVVQGRLTQEKMESPFPPYFQPTNFTMGLSPDLLEFESTRNKAVAAALAQWHQAQAALKNRQIQKDRQKITQLKVLVKAAMKAGHASAVVSAVAQLKQARQQLQQDMANTSPVLPQLMGQGVGGGSGGNSGNTGGNNNAIGSGTEPGLDQSSGGAGIEPRSDWPKMVRQANAPQPPGSAVSLATALKNDPQGLVGGRVVWNLNSGLGLALSARQRLGWRLLRRKIRQHFLAIRQEARHRETAEYNYQLSLLHQSNPNSTIWQVAWPVKHAEQIERAKVSRLAKKLEHKDIKLLAACLQVPRLHLRLVGVKGVTVPTRGPIYGVVLAARAVVTNPSTPAFTLPSGTSLRAQALGVQAFGAMPALQPVPAFGSFLTQVPERDIPSMPVGEQKSEHITMLYCGRYPHSRGTNGTKKGSGYVFIMKDGSKLRVSSYTTGQSYYHAVWDGVAMPLAKNLVVKIKPQ